MTLPVVPLFQKASGFNPEAVTNTFGILGKKGSGKTTTAVVIAEAMLSAEAQVLIIDPLDVWWGLRSSADGKEEGFPITIIGGHHGDVPLEDTSGKVLAEFVVRNNVSAIFSIRHLSGAAQRRFVAAFATSLFEIKAHAQFRSPVHLFIDEADAFAPQRVMADKAVVAGSIDELVRRGRSSGIGVTLISQRPAVLNKDVLTQIDTLIAMRTIGPPDRNALKTWVQTHDDGNQTTEFFESLPKLQTGEAWIWSPEWLNLMVRTTVPNRTTFDSSATPKVGSARRTAKRMAAVDLEALSKAIADTIEKNRQDNPRFLKDRIRTLEQQLQERPAPVSIDIQHERRLGYLQAFEEIKPKLEALASIFRQKATDIHAVGGVLKTTADQLDSMLTDPKLGTSDKQLLQTARQPEKKPAAGTDAVQRRQLIENRAGSVAAATSISEKNILTALAQFQTGLTLQRLAFLSGYTINGHFNNMLGSLRTKGLISPARVSPITITDAGLSALGSYEPLPTGVRLQEYWINKMGASEGKILRTLVDIYPDSLSLEELARRSGYTVNGHFNNMIGHLRSVGLMSPARTPPKAADELF